MEKIKDFWISQFNDLFFWIGASIGVIGVMGFIGTEFDPLFYYVSATWALVPMRLCPKFSMGFLVSFGIISFVVSLILKVNTMNMFLFFLLSLFFINWLIQIYSDKTKKAKL